MESDFSAYDPDLGQLWEDYRANPDNAELLHALCFALNLRGRHQTCITLARLGLAKNPHHANLYYEMLVAASHVAGEQLSVIGPEIENMFAERPGDLGAKRNLALYYFYMENDADAAVLLSEILTQFDADQVDLFTYEILAQLEHANNHFLEGLDFCDRGLMKQGPGARLERLKGLCHLGLDQSIQAQAAFEQALELEPQFLWACHSLGTLYFEKGDYQNAFAFFGKATSINPADPHHYFLLAEAFMDQGAFRLAASELEKLIWSKPPAHILPEAHNALGYLWIQAGQWAQAGHHLNQAIKLSPEMAPAHFHRGLLAQKQGDHPNAHRYFDHALELDDQHLEAWVALGFLHLEGQDYDGAETCFETALDLDPESAQAYLGLSQVAEGRGLPQNQLMYAKTAVQLEPEHPGNHLQLSKAFVANKNYSQAGDALLASLDRDPNQIEAVNFLIATAPALREDTHFIAEVLSFIKGLSGDSQLDEAMRVKLTHLQNLIQGEDLAHHD